VIDLVVNFTGIINRNSAIPRGDDALSHIAVGDQMQETTVGSLFVFLFWLLGWVAVVALVAYLFRGYWLPFILALAGYSQEMKERQEEALVEELLRRRKKGGNE
jgi:hypothetical protein